MPRPWILKPKKRSDRSLPVKTLLWLLLPIWKSRCLPDPLHQLIVDLLLTGGKNMMGPTAWIRLCGYIDPGRNDLVRQAECYHQKRLRTVFFLSYPHKRGAGKHVLIIKGNLSFLKFDPDIRDILQYFLLQDPVNGKRIRVKFKKSQPPVQRVVCSRAISPCY